MPNLQTGRELIRGPFAVLHLDDSLQEGRIGPVFLIFPFFPIEPCHSNTVPDQLFEQDVLTGPLRLADAFDRRLWQ